MEDAASERKANRLNLSRLTAVVLPLILFVVLVLATLSNGQVPAVFDGNETFSSLLHAKNLQTYGLERTSGLADESTALSAEGHPVLHTHQGNFPRLPAYVLSVLGISSPWMQVAVHALVVGGAALVLFQMFLLRHLRPLVVLLIGLLLVTDYILFFQWQLVTYRVWHFVFLSSLLYFGTRYIETGYSRFLYVFSFTTLCLFYYEFLFSVFLSLWVGIYFIFAYALQQREVVKEASLSRATRRVLSLGGAGVLTSVASVAVLVAQLIHHYGVEGFLTDLSLTFGSRNWGTFSASEAPAELVQFVESRNVAFFYNIVDSSTLRTLGGAKQLLVDYGVSIYSAVLAAVAIFLGIGCALRGLVSRWYSQGTTTLFSGRQVGPIVVWPFVAAITIGSVIAMTVRGPVQFASVLLFICIMGAAFAPVRRVGVDRSTGALLVFFPLLAAMAWAFSEGEPWFADAISLPPAIALAALCTAGFVAVLFRATPRGAQIPIAALFGFTVTIFGALAVFAIAGPWFASSPAAPMNQLFHPLLGIVGRTAVILVVLTLAGLFWSGPAAGGWWALIGLDRAQVRRLCALFGAGAVGVAVVFLAVPGYLFSGYLWRTQNPLSVLFVAAFAVLISGLWRGKIKFAAPVQRLVQATGAAALAAVLLQWSIVQIQYVGQFPPTGFEVISKLSGPEFQGKSIVSSGYAVPFAVTTNGWGYLDHRIGEGRVNPGAGRPALVQDRRYFWFADRFTNQDYERPDLFVCYVNQGFGTLPADVSGPRYRFCSNVELVRQARHPDGIWPDHRLLAADASGRDLWAIVELDWRPVVSAAVSRLRFTRTMTGWNADLSASLQGEVTGGVQLEVELLPVSSLGSTCTLSPAAGRQVVVIDHRVREASFTLAVPGLPGASHYILRLQSNMGDIKMPPVFSPPFSAPFQARPPSIQDHSCGTVIDADRTVIER